MEIINYFPKNLQVIRTAIRATVEALADLLQVDRTTISNWESAKSNPSLQNLIRISSLFEVTLDELCCANIPEELIKIFGSNSQQYLEKTYIPISNDYNALFPINLKVLSRAKGMTQKELAKALKVSRKTILSWEKGKRTPSLNNLIEISAFFEITLDKLFCVHITKAFEDAFRDNFNKYLDTDANPFSDEDETLFPHLSSPILKGLDAYRQALEIDNTGPHPLEDRFNTMLSLYYEAFHAGILAAGINLLKILSRLHMVLRAVSDEPEQFDYPFQHHMEWILSVFRALGHPIAEYYEAAALIYMCMKTDLDADAASEEGLLAMYALAEEGNGYAIAFWDKINSVDDQLPDLNA